MSEKNMVIEGTIRSITNKETRKEDLDKETTSMHVQNTDGHKVRIDVPQGHAMGYAPGEHVKVVVSRTNKTLSEVTGE
jgi:hypothetical protein